MRKERGCERSCALFLDTELTHAINSKLKHEICSKINLRVGGRVFLDILLLRRLRKRVQGHGLQYEAFRY